MRHFVLIVSLILTQALPAQEKSAMDAQIVNTEAEWKEILTPEQYYILRQKGTDMPGEGGYTKHFEKGTYHCAACDAQLFESGTKYESHCGCE